MERLAKSTRRLIWINPLLRYEGFEPKAAGIRAMLPYVDDFRSSHNLKSLAELTDVLSHVQPRGVTAYGVRSCMLATGIDFPIANMQDLTPHRSR